MNWWAWNQRTSFISCSIYIPCSFLNPFICLCRFIIMELNKGLLRRKSNWYHYWGCAVRACLLRTCVFETSVLLHYNVCNKMMEKGRNMWDVKCFFPSSSFYYIHSSEAIHSFQTHTFRSRQALILYVNDFPC